MDEIEIKEELNIKNRCRTCLSIGRKLKPIREYYDIYKKMVAETYHQDIVEILICWECEALLKKAKRFQLHVRKANKVLQFGQNHLHGPLSNLTTILLNETHPNVIYLTDTNIKTNDNQLDPSPNTSDDNYDAEDSIAVKIERLTEKEVNTESFKEENEVKIAKIKKVNRWALKRAEKNKKPKFKIFDNVENCYRTLRMSLDEMKELRSRDRECFKERYKCEICEVGFGIESLFEKHKGKVHGKSSTHYICDICKKRFINKRHLSAHIQKHYNKYSCVLCSYVCCKKTDIETHIQMHKRVFECIKCGLKFGQRREFYKHYKEWHEKYICDHCGISFKMRYCIKDHIRKQHSPFECKPCNKRFARYGGLWLHNKTRHSASTGLAYCVECDTKYVDVYRYKWHLNNSARHRRNRTKRKIPCPDCDKVFTKNIYMRDHHDLVHLKNFKYRCEECDKNFIRNADLVKHRRRVHEGILPPKNKICYMCGRGFTTNKILANHLRTHSGERPFACSCGARFAQLAARAQHARLTGHQLATSL